MAVERLLSICIDPDHSRLDSGIWLGHSVLHAHFIVILTSLHFSFKGGM